MMQLYFDDHSGGCHAPGLLCCDGERQQDFNDSQILALASDADVKRLQEISEQQAGLPAMGDSIVACFLKYDVPLRLDMSCYYSVQFADLEKRPFICHPFFSTNNDQVLFKKEESDRLPLGYTITLSGKAAYLLLSCLHRLSLIPDLRVTTVESDNAAREALIVQREQCHKSIERGLMGALGLYISEKELITLIQCYV